MTIFLLSTTDAFGQDKPKLKGEDVLAKHLASIGTPEAIAGAANRKIEGTGQARNVRTSLSTVAGGAFLASTREKHLLLLAFTTGSIAEYRGESINFDGKKIDIPFVTASSRSPLGGFIFEYPEIVRQYLLGGCLFSSWALFDTGKIGKFELQGKEKIGDIETYKMKIVPKGGSALTIKMFFDTANFRHVRTEYQRTMTAGTVRVDEGRATEERFKLIEDFSDYRQINSLFLPTTYKVTFRFETLQRNGDFEWLIKLTRFAFDPKAEPEIFSQGQNAVGASTAGVILRFPFGLRDLGIYQNVAKGSEW